MAKNVQGYDAGLPYLLKVLSIRAALSIQAHPDAELAKELNAKFPNVYRDPNHKPELAIAITPMDAMCSFRTIPQIALYLQTVPELRAVVGEEIAQRFLDSANVFKEPATQPYDLTDDMRTSLRNLFQSLMNADCDVVKSQLEILLARLPSTITAEAAPTDYWKYLVDQIQTIALAYPGDVGLFAVFLLNVIRLQPGEAIFLAQNEPHAYLFGDCVECMATSDNVVRAGLTPKFKDVDTLVRMLTYRAGAPKIYRGEALQGEATQRCVLYAPPVSEFVIEKFELSPQESTVVDNFKPSIFLCIEGSDKNVINESNAFAAGTAYFAHPGSSFCVANNSDARLVFFKATQP